MTSEGRQRCSPLAQTNGRAPRRHLSIGGDLQLSGGHLITLSQWPEIKNVLLCLWLCRDLKPGRAGEQSTEYRRSQMKMVYSLAFLLTTSARGELCNRTFFSLFSVDCGFMWPLSRGSEGSQTTQITEKFQQARHMVAKKPPVQ